MTMPLIPSSAHSTIVSSGQPESGNSLGSEEGIGVVIIVGFSVGLFDGISVEGDTGGLLVVGKAVALIVVGKFDDGAVVVGNLVGPKLGRRFGALVVGAKDVGEFVSWTLGSDKVGARVRNVVGNDDGAISPH